MLGSVVNPPVATGVNSQRKDSPAMNGSLRAPASWRVFFNVPKLIQFGYSPETTWLRQTGPTPAHKSDTALVADG
jgi:hypothetical protein